MVRGFGKVIHFLANILYLFISIYVVVCIPMIFGYKPLVVLSGSMEPTYKTGSIIYYEKISNNELLKGDVIVFYNSKKEVISHRIVSIADDGIETKGDANNTSDPQKVGYNDVIGKVGGVSLLFVGFYIKFINDNLILFVIISVIILVFDFLMSNFAKKDLGKKGVEK